MKKKLTIVLLIIMLFNMLYIQPVYAYAQTILIESIKQKATELALIKLAVATGAAVTTYHTAKGFVQDMVNSAPDVFNDFKDSVVDNITNKLKFAHVVSDTVWQGAKAFISGLNKPISEPIEYIPESVNYVNVVSGIGDFTAQYVAQGNKHTVIFDGVSYSKEFLDTVTSGLILNTDGYSFEYDGQTYFYNGLDTVIDKINKGESFSNLKIRLFYVMTINALNGNTYPVSLLEANFNYNNTTGILSYLNRQIQVTEANYKPVPINPDGSIYYPGSITLDPRSIDPDDDFVNDKTGDTPKRLVGFPLPWSELPSVSEGVINDGIDLGTLSNAQLEAIDLTLQGLLEQVDTLSTDLVRTEDLLREALVNPPIDTTGVIPAIESIGNIITNAFNPPTISLNLTPLMNISILTNKFPFSIPWDLKNSISLLLDSPDPPIFEIPFNFGGLMEGVTLDFTIFDPVIGLFRWLITIAFTIALIYFSTVFI